jgi:hypothetical protein
VSCVPSKRTPRRAPSRDVDARPVRPSNRHLPPLAELDLLTGVLDRVVRAVRDHTETLGLREEVGHCLEAVGGPLVIANGNGRKGERDQQANHGRACGAPSPWKDISHISPGRELKDRSLAAL